MGIFVLFYRNNDYVSGKIIPYFFHSLITIHSITNSIMCPLSRIEEMLLLAVCRLGDKAYGITIRRQIEASMQRTFSIGAIYVPLDRLEQKGYLSSYMGAPTQMRGGRSKRFYKITASGIEALKTTRALNEAIWADMPNLDGLLPGTV